jgi:hypothetical protein
MAKMDFDPVDAAFTITLAATGFMMVGIASFNVFDVSFGETAFTLMGQDLSLAYCLSAGALIGTVVTNDNAQLSSLGDQVDDLDQYYYFSVLATGGLLVGWLFIPAIPEFFQSQDLWGITYVAVTTTGQFALGWML